MTAVTYTDKNNLITELNLQQDSSNPNNYILWAIPTSSDVISYYVNQANEYTTQVFGDLSSSDSFPLAKQFATKMASLWLIQNMSTNIALSGVRLGVGAVSVERLPALNDAFTKLEASLKEQIDRLYQMLCQVESFDAYHPSSPYITTRGQSWIP
jgi:hypothetical protein